MISNRILIVENNTISANEIRVAIESLGYEDIRVVYFGKEVLKELNLRIVGQITVFLKFIEEEYVLTISDNGYRFI